MKMGINNSNTLSEYLRIKYEIPSNIIVIFSFEINEIHNYDLNFLAKLASEDIPEEWYHMLSMARKEMETREVSHPIISLVSEVYGSVAFWES
jgi:hypothetical protein